MVSLGRWLKKRDQHRGLSEVGKVTQRAHDLERGRAVQSSADLIQEKRLLGADKQLPGGDALPLTAADSSNLIIANQRL